MCVHACGDLTFVSRTFLDAFSTLYMKRGVSLSNLEHEVVATFSPAHLFWGSEPRIPVDPVQPGLIWVLGI